MQSVIQYQKLVLKKKRLNQFHSYLLTSADSAHNEVICQCISSWFVCFFSAGTTFVSYFLEEFVLCQRTCARKPNLQFQVQQQ